MLDLKFYIFALLITVDAIESPGVAKSVPFNDLTDLQDSYGLPGDPRQYYKDVQPRWLLARRTSTDDWHCPPWSAVNPQGQIGDGWYLDPTKPGVHETCDGNADVGQMYVREGTHFSGNRGLVFASYFPINHQDLDIINRWEVSVVWFKGQERFPYAMKYLSPDGWITEWNREHVTHPMFVRSSGALKGLVLTKDYPHTHPTTPALVAWENLSPARQNAFNAWDLGRDDGPRGNSPPIVHDVLRGILNEAYVAPP